MRNGTDDVTRLLDSSGLPAAVLERIFHAVSRSGLRPTERVDVARELIAHFEDGLAAGQNVDALLTDFGDDNVAADLIRAAKWTARRARAVDERSGRSGDAIVWVLARDLRYAARRLQQNPGFTLTAILSLALGIGANTAIFSVVNMFLLQQLPVPRPEELVEVYQSSDDFPHNVFSVPDYIDFRDRTTESFSILAGTSIAPGALDSGGSVETIIMEAVTGTYFPLLELPASRGRLLGPEDDVAPGAHPVVVLDHGFWQRRFGSDDHIVGEQIVVSGTPLSVIGVAPPEHRGMIRGVRPAMYVSIQMKDTIVGNANSELTRRGAHSFFVRGRLAEGVTIEQATQSARAVEIDMRELYPTEWHSDNEFLLMATSSVVVFPMFDGFLRAGAWLILSVVGMVLLMACANLAGFLLARSVDRRKEISIRLALGATRGKLVGQLLSEAVLLSMIGGIAGLGLAWWMLRALATADIPFPIPMTLEFSIDGQVLLFTAATSLLAGILFGLAPALQATGYEVASTLRDESAGGGRVGRLRLRSALVVGQVAVSVILLVTAGLLVRSVQAIQTLDPGFGTDASAILSISVPSTRYTSEETNVLFDELRSEFQALPTLEAVGFITNLHLNQASTELYELSVDGVAPPAGREYHIVDWASIDSEFLEAAGIELLSGRPFAARDDVTGQPVAIVSAAFAQRFYPDGLAVGNTFRDTDGIELEIVGVAGDAKVRSIGESPRPFLYRPYTQTSPQFVTFVGRTDGDAEAAATAMLRSLRARVPDLLVLETRTMEEHLDVVRFPARLAATAVGTFAILALALAAVGLFGLVSYSQAQRAREVGIRMSLGAEAGSVVFLLLRDGMSLVVLGGGIGIVAAFAVSRLLGGLLFGVAASDPVTFVAAPVLLGVTAFVASWLPARRASRIDPVVALRTE